MDSFLQEKAEQGELDSKGQFSLDFRRASKLLRSLANDDSFFCFLKILQVAHRLAAERLDFQLSSGRLAAFFETEETEGLDQLGNLLRATCEPDSRVNPVVADLRAALLGGTQLGASVTWTTAASGRAQVLKIEKSGRVTTRLDVPELGRPREPNRRAWRYEVQLKHGWKFWEVGRRKRQLKELLATKCAFSQVDLRVNGAPIERADSSVLNSHLREFLGTQFNAAIGAMQTLKSRVAPSNILIQTASFGVAVAQPDLACYTRRAEHLIWGQGLRENNSFRPDSDDSPAWMLQYLGEPIDVDDKVVCSAIIAFNIHGPGNQEAVRIKVVRRGVTLMESKLKGERFDKFRGCTILFHDDELPTDLSGLRLVEGEELLQRVEAFAPLVERGHAYFLGGAEYVNWA